MAKKLRVVLDTNIIVSAIIFKGKPRQILELAYEENIKPIISPALLSELIEVLTKKFTLPPEDVSFTEEEIKDAFEIVYPTITLNVQRDVDDNRVLEAALEGKCKYIITGDKELLDLGAFKGIKIVTSDQFLNL